MFGSIRSSVCPASHGYHRGVQGWYFAYLWGVIWLVRCYYFWVLSLQTKTHKQMDGQGTNTTKCILSPCYTVDNKFPQISIDPHHSLICLILIWCHQIQIALQNENAPALMHVPRPVMLSSFAQKSFYHDEFFIRLILSTYTDGTDSISSTADVGGKKYSYKKTVDEVNVKSAF